MVNLLDVNVLLALAWPSHVHHQAAHHWFAANRVQGWASCPVTQSGFVRLSANRNVVPDAVSPLEAIAVIERSAQQADHQFWAQNTAVWEFPPDMITRIMGPRHVSDAVLLDLAIRRGGRLATLDEGIAKLLPKGSKLRAHLEVIPTTA